jgi:NAD(P)-dependent dehydrogenase (short-subunit alcohol dehydrogenase family)
MAESQVLGGKTAVVTGASAGIGLACAKYLVADGAAVLIMGRKEKALSKARMDLLQQVPRGRVEIFAGDACEEDAVKEALDRAFAIADRLDILVPTVGGGAFKPVLLQDAATFRREFELNVISAFLMIRYGVPLMEAGGSIVCISAVPVIQPFTGLSAYLSSKAALERFVRAAADELGRAKVRINSVRPGLTLTAATVDFFANPALLENFIAHIPLGRAGEPDDIARVVRFLAGPESGWVTGQNFAADGGQGQRQVPDLLDAAFGKDFMDKVRAGKPRQDASAEK